VGRDPLPERAIWSMRVGRCPLDASDRGSASRSSVGWEGGGADGRPVGLPRGTLLPMSDDAAQPRPFAVAPPDASPRRPWTSNSCCGALLPLSRQLARRWNRRGSGRAWPRGASPPHSASPSQRSAGSSPAAWPRRPMTSWSSPGRWRSLSRLSLGPRRPWHAATDGRAGRLISMPLVAWRTPCLRASFPTLLRWEALFGPCARRERAASHWQRPRLRSSCRWASPIR